MAPPAFSSNPSGSQARSTVTRVVWSPSGRNVTIPLCRTSPSVLRQAMRSSGSCSTISASNSRRAPATSVTQWVCRSSSCRIAMTPDMNCGKDSNCVHWL